MFRQSKSVGEAIAVLGAAPDLAVSRMRLAVAEAPSDLSAHAQLVDWFLDQPVSPALHREFDFHVQDEVRGGQDRRRIQTFARVRGRQDFCPSDRALLLVSQAAARTGDNALAVDVVRELMRVHPRSPLIPRAMWDVSQIQERAGQHAVAGRTRLAWVEGYPDDPYASQARQSLA
ncbi:MAG: tetratricopeptide repeat protein [Nannocystales bacterium]